MRQIQHGISKWWKKLNPQSGMLTITDIWTRSEDNIIYIKENLPVKTLIFKTPEKSISSRISWWHYTEGQSTKYIPIGTWRVAFWIMIWGSFGSLESTQNFIVSPSCLQSTNFTLIPGGIPIIFIANQYLYIF